MTISNTGLSLLRNLLAGDTINLNQMAVGNGTTGASTTDTELDNETLRKTASAAKSTTAGVVTKSITIASTDLSNQNISEVGVFDATSGGNMLDRIVFPSTLHAAGTEIRVDIQFTFRRG